MIRIKNYWGLWSLKRLMAKNLGITAEIDGKDLLDAVDLLKDLGVY